MKIDSARPVNHHMIMYPNANECMYFDRDIAQLHNDTIVEVKGSERKKVLVALSDYGGCDS